MMFILAIVVPLSLIFSPLCEKMGGFSKFIVFAITAPVTLFVVAAFSVADQTPEQRQQQRQETFEREQKEKHDRWDAEARERAEKKFYDATREYRP